MPISLSKYGLALALGLVIATISVGQNQSDERKGQFTGLVKAALVTSQIYGDDVGGYDKLGFSGGVGVSTSLAPNLDIQLETNYSLRGSRKPPNRKINDFTTATIGVQYIDVPILLKFWVWKFEFEAGVCNGIYLNHTEKFNGAKLPEAQYVWNFWRYELAANVGVYAPIGDKWAGSARFHYSVLPAAGKLGVVSGFSVVGGAYNNALTFGVYRYFRPKS